MKPRLWIATVAALTAVAVLAPVTSATDPAAEALALPVEVHPLLRTVAAEARRAGVPAIADALTRMTTPPERAVPSVPLVADPNLFVTLAVPDLDGDRLDDLLDVKFANVVGQNEMIARAGETGRVLWRLASDHGFSVPLPAAVGPRGRNGFLRLDLDFTAAGITYLGFAGVDPAGRILFETEWPTTSRRVASIVLPKLLGVDEIPRLTGFLRRRPGRPVDVLFDYPSRDPVLRQLGARDMVLMSAGDGRYHRERTVLTGGTATFGIFGVGDVTLDGNDDYAVIRSAAAGLVADLSALGILGNVDLVDGISDALVTTASPVPTNAESTAEDVGDLDGDRRAETIVTRPSADRPSLLLPATATGLVSLLGVSEGGVYWTRPGHWPLRVGDISRDGANDVVIAEVRITESEHVLQLTAYTAGGRTLWDRRVSTVPAGRFLLVGAYTYGDLQPDRVQELRFVNYDEGGRRSDVGVVDGRSGRLLYRPPPGEWSLYESMDGSGTDLTIQDLATRERPGRRLRVIDGARRGVLSTLDFPRGFDFVQPVALRRAPGACVQLVANVWFRGPAEKIPGPRDLFGFQERALSPAWSVRRALLAEGRSDAVPSTRSVARRCR